MVDDVCPPSNSIWPHLSYDLVRSKREYCQNCSLVVVVVVVETHGYYYIFMKFVTTLLVKRGSFCKLSLITVSIVLRSFL